MLLVGVLPSPMASAAPLRLEAPSSVRPLILKYVSAFDAKGSDADQDVSPEDEANDLRTDEGDTLARIRRARKEIPEQIGRAHV